MVAEFGWYRVYAAGLDCFGYPPTWEPSLRELLDLKTLLNRS